MADVLLGPSGSETVLPNVRFIGSSPDWPVSTNKQARKMQMSDGSFRWAFFGTLKVFQIGFGYLSNADLLILKNLNERNEILRYKNEHEENVWYNVVISSFNHTPERVDIRGLDRYKTTMTLEETDMSCRD